MPPMLDEDEEISEETVMDLEHLLGGTSATLVSDALLDGCRYIGAAHTEDRVESDCLRKIGKCLALLVVQSRSVGRS